MKIMVQTDEDKEKLDLALDVILFAESTDFVLENRAFQACYSLTEDNIKRELTGLEEIKKINPEITGTIILVDENDFSYPSKEAVPYWKWQGMPHAYR
jgi:hypothetical protein